MIETFYNYTLLAGWITPLLFGICLLAVRTPDGAVYVTYRRSCRILGMAYLIFALSIFLHWLFNIRENTPQVATALNLTCYYLEGILFGMSFISLLDKRYINRKCTVRDFSKWTATCLLLWLAALFMEGGTRIVLLVTASVCFVADALRIVLTFFGTYRAAVRKVDDYYADNVSDYARWLYRSSIGIIVFGLAGSVLAFAPPACNAVYMFLGIGMFTYIFISLQNYIVNYAEVKTAVDVEEPETKSAHATDAKRGKDDTCHPEADTSPAEGDYRKESCAEAPAEEAGVFADRKSTDSDFIANAVNEWVYQKRYLQKGITSEDLIVGYGINRSYLSAYINNTYRCNFREWVNSLRMEYAKRRLVEEPDRTIDRIAEETGFSSAAYFCNQFSKREGMSPMKWRKSRTGTL